MRIPRQLAVTINHGLDEWVPPAIRDAKWFMRPAMKALFRDRTDDFATFKDKAFGLSEREFSDVYRRVAPVLIDRETDLNHRCIQRILGAVAGSTVLEAGTGRGYLSGLLSRSFDVTGTDIIVPVEVRERYPRVTFQEANVESLPFPDDSFDTVVCTHTLEHVQNLQAAVRELRRVAKDRLIIVVPRQRPYKHSFDLHIHFFPYAWSLQSHFGYRDHCRVTLIGDWFYVEDNPVAELGDHRRSLRHQPLPQRG
ncbi:class I SAM-dependent methyltransferase [Streptomyces sp. NBC_00390]|uniref:class I SAM-dependent methyltransferase n=1 Tax=Streptomyces sp. NBC_00390 TaxID=2975736 RepID=UPI002E2515F5